MHKQSCGKVMFSHLSVILFTGKEGVYLSMQWAGGVYPSIHWAGACVSQHALGRGVCPVGVCPGVCVSAHGGCLPKGVSAQGASVLGVSTQGGVCQWVSVQGCQPGGMSAQGEVCPGRVCSEGCLPKVGVCPGGCTTARLSDTVGIHTVMNYEEMGFKRRNYLVRLSLQTSMNIPLQTWQDRDISLQYTLMFCVAQLVIETLW